MIELKLSQGAKPGYGGFLPAAKNTPEVAAIRGIPPWTDILSPPRHTAFDSPRSLLRFLQELRELSGGKPVGIKLAIGRRSEFLSLCLAMVEEGLFPDFITVDGGEGGSGAAPLEYCNSVGMPLLDALAFVVDALVGFGLKRHIRVIASGKILTGFHLIRCLALGADLGNSGRGMMLALGCVHALRCHTNRCPSGVATQNPELYLGLVVEEKARRVRNFHGGTVHAACDLLSSAGLRHPSQLSRAHLFRRISPLEILRYDQIYPPLEEGCLLRGEVPKWLQADLAEADPDRFL